MCWGMCTAELRVSGCFFQKTLVFGLVFGGLFEATMLQEDVPSQVVLLWLMGTMRTSHLVAFCLCLCFPGASEPTLVGRSGWPRGI